MASPSTLHPCWLRITHWLNVVAVLIMVTSGARIYNASPLFNFMIPASLTLGGWLGGALQWHFAGMWLLGLNGVLYLSLNLATGRMWRRFFPISPRGIVCDLAAALRGKLAHTDTHRYNQVQKAAYLLVMLDIALLTVSGLVLWQSVQLGLLRDLLGGYETARLVHFIAMGLLITFVLVHLFMVASAPRTLRAMITGR